MEACEIVQVLEESGKFLYNLSIGKACNCPEAIKEDIITLAQFKNKNTFSCHKTPQAKTTDK